MLINKGLFKGLRFLKNHLSPSVKKTTHRKEYKERKKRAKRSEAVLYHSIDILIYKPFLYSYSLYHSYIYTNNLCQAL